MATTHKLLQIVVVQIITHFWCNTSRRTVTDCVRRGVQRRTAPLNGRRTSGALAGNFLNIEDDTITPMLIIDSNRFATQERVFPLFIYAGLTHTVRRGEHRL
jgi:hypothetical protein